jgi:hypothetical protein
MQVRSPQVCIIFDDRIQYITRGLIKRFIFSIGRPKELMHKNEVRLYQSLMQKYWGNHEGVWGGGGPYRFMHLSDLYIL